MTLCLGCLFKLAPRLSSRNAVPETTLMTDTSTTAPLPSDDSTVSTQTTEEIGEKYKSLKRQYAQLEQDSGAEGSEVRNVRRREEKEHLLQEIQDLEGRLQSNANTPVVPEQPPAQPGVPRIIRSPQARNLVASAYNSYIFNSPTKQLSKQAEQQQAEGSNASRVRQATTSTDVDMDVGNQSVDTPKTSPRRTTRKTRATAKAAAGTNGKPASTTQQATSPEPSKPVNESTTTIHTITDTHNNENNAGNPVASSSTTLAEVLSVSPTPNGDASHLQTIQNTPSVESILKVAEAAVAAQNAANQAKLEAMMRSQPSRPAVDPNLDPSLASASSNVSASSSSGETTPATGASNNPNPTPDASGATSSSSATPSTTTPIISSSLSNNPYATLLPRAGNSTANTMYPYPLFYPPLPGAPVAPTNPTSYHIPYNPYYYLTAPIPGPNGLYPPPPPNFPLSPAQPQRSASADRPAKPKRLKAHTVTTKSFSIPLVPRDKQNKPMLPLNVGIMTVISLGEVCMRDHFHTERYIFPVGYEVTRRYLSTVDPSSEVVYHCTILDGGDGPKFQIIPSDRPDRPIIAGTATGAWSNIVKQANAIRNRQHSNSVSGPDFFGLGQNTIKHLIQELPNADRLRDYVWQNFVEGGPLGGRHAAVIPALPEEYDSSMPLGAYYPKRDEQVDTTVPKGLSHYPQHIIAQAEAEKAQKLAQDHLRHRLHQLTQPQGQYQPQPIAGPSNPSALPQQVLANGQPHPQIMPGLGAIDGGLTIQEYQPPQEKQQQRNGKNPATGGVASPSSNAAAASAPARATRASTREEQLQQLQQQISAAQAQQQSLGIPMSGAEEASMATTFASIMSAYPVPGVSAPAISEHSTTSS
ncbi:hypothetical protein D9619_013217 [Psilocybe cf. subviscida]|uniref:Transforming growth factor beta regulator 1 n=1 Tax=Psilocybe cf. subviscida TaxID=2480587 RepID=A0A8H5B6B4_9AGAR|nr:hypothetical protein D9619_013217 [Psilocybe cf. subviscida]